jgi:hypothetical protein
MTPTCRLRFVEREIQVPFQDYKDITESKIVSILQQWWQAHATGMTSTNGEEWVAASAGEWRDVPLEEEKA